MDQQWGCRMNDVKRMIFEYVIPCIVITLFFGAFFLSFGDSFDKEMKFQDKAYKVSLNWFHDEYLKDNIDGSDLYKKIKEEKRSIL